MLVYSSMQVRFFQVALSWGPLSIAPASSSHFSNLVISISSMHQEECLHVLGGRSYYLQSKLTYHCSPWLPSQLHPHQNIFLLQYWWRIRKDLVIHRYRNHHHASSYLPLVSWLISVVGFKHSNYYFWGWMLQVLYTSNFYPQLH